MKTENRILEKEFWNNKADAAIQALNVQGSMPDFSLENLDDLQKNIEAKIPFVKDEYSNLRYTTFFLKNHLQPEILETPLYQSNAIFNSELLETLSRGHSREKPNGKQLDENIADILNHTAILKGVMRNGVSLCYAELLANLGRNAYINALIRDCIRIKLTDYDHRDNFRHMARSKILNPATEPESVVLLLDINAEHKLAALSEKRNRNFSRALASADGNPACRISIHRGVENDLPASIFTPEAWKI